jgi:GT2 family glycosyltransferase
MEQAPASPSPRSNPAHHRTGTDTDAVAEEPRRPSGSIGVTGRWLGRDTAFTLEPADDPVFDRRLVLKGHVSDRWIVLTYRLDPIAPPARPIIRFLRTKHEKQDVVLPGVALESGSWLGLIPADLDEIRLAAGLGFVLERVGLRHHASVFAECLGKRPIRTLPALYNRLKGDERRFRDILRGACAVSPIARYAEWRATRSDSAIQEESRSSLVIRVVVPARRSEASAVALTLASVMAQSHDARLVTIAWIDGIPERDTDALAADPSVSACAWSGDARPADLLAGADALGFLHPGDLLSRDALAVLAGRLAAADAPDCVYADEETAGSNPRPLLKPDWSPDLAMVAGYTGRPMLLSRALCERIADHPVGAPDGLAFTLAASSAARSVAHVPRILCRTQESGQADLAARAKALEAHLASTGSPASAELSGGVLDLHWPVPQPAPLVSIVIPSRDRLDLITRVTEDVLHGTDYPAIELVIVDNGSTDPAVLQLYDRLRADPRVRIEPYPHPFNFSAMSNVGVCASTGAVLVLLNNDIAVLDPSWLSAMVGQAVRPEVGAVGAKLLYGDGTLQHAGVVVGLGGRAGHILRRRPGDTPGHLGRLRVAHEVSAVTAACLAVERCTYDAVGGFDETAFAIDFNDVDFCLRLGAHGFKTIWTPKATLSHLESVSRGRPQGEERRRFEREADAFAERWHGVIRHDPFYHPAFSLTTFGEDLE